MPCGLSARTFVHHPFYSSTGKSPPPRAIGKINPWRGSVRKSATSLRPGGQFCLRRRWLEEWGKGSEREEVAWRSSRSPKPNLVDRLALNEVSASRAQPRGAWTRELGE